MYSPEQHYLNNLPQLDLIQVLNSRNNTSNLHPNLNIPSQSNFQYYTTDTFQTNDIINEFKKLINNSGAKHKEKS
jgi:hypothetical protein